ncbi:MAG: glycosyltransferase family 2 protein [Lachnospiraceae bacterium]|nr:glycosyltransferase family 2 protein [Lachnospiraceae bacterium]
MANMISLIIPCYNEEESFAPLYEKLCSISKDMKERYGVAFEFLMINDGSRDDTLSKIKEVAHLDSRVKYISFSRNFGKEAAIYAGLQNCNGDYAVVMDADLQHPPDMLPLMYESIVTEGYDCATAYRENREGEPKIRSFFARNFYKLINKIAQVKMTDGATDFSMMTRQVVDAILTMPEYNRFYKGIHSWVGFETKWLPYKNIERAYGTTTWSFTGLFRYSMEGILSFSTAPLVIASLMGIFLFFLSLLVISYVILRTVFFGDPVAGFPTLISVILFVGGGQFFCLGIIGQYISKMYLEIKRRPAYLIKDSNLH